MVDSEDMGVIINEKLFCSDHLAEKVIEANKVVGLITRNFVALDAKVFKALLKAVIRPH